MFKRFLSNLIAYVLFLHRTIKLDKSILNTLIYGNAYETDVTTDWKAVCIRSLKMSFGLSQNLS